MKKINLVVAIVLCMFLLGIFGCAPAEVQEETQPEEKLEPVKEINALRIYHWWQSSGELAAINALVAEFSKQYPDTAIMASYVQGGGGMEMIAKIKPMILANEAPDSFVAHPGYEIYPYVMEGLLQNLDDIWKSEGLEQAMPEALQKVSKIDGHYYVVPLDIHRNNLVWYNKALLDKNSIDPSTLGDWDSFFAACDKLNENGVTSPIQMGRAWTATFAFTNILLGKGGPDYYESFINGKITSENDPKLIDILTTFKKYLTYTNPDSADISWSDATGRVIKGEGAFNIMGDWANGEYKIAGMKYNRDYGTISVPGTDGLHLLVVDAFVKPKGITHPTSADNWLKVVGSRAGQDAFNPEKGSITSRKDAELNNYDDYQKSAIEYFQNARLVIDTGSALPFGFRDELNTIMTEFVQDRDVNKAAKAIADYTKATQSDFSMVWTIE